MQWIDESRPTHLHVHEFWRAAFVVGMLAARLRDIPIVLSAHGLTAPIALSNQGWPRRLKKLLYWNLLGRHLMPPNCRLHAITQLESQHFSSFFSRTADVVIPNAIDLDSFPATLLAEVLRPTKTILFLGRLHPIKGVDLLIEAFAASSLDTSWELLIAGPEEIPEFVDKLKKMAIDAAPRRIRFLGHCSGVRKLRLLASAWVLAAPSHSEVIGMVNLEAAAMRTRDGAQRPRVVAPQGGRDRPGTRMKSRTPSAPRPRRRRLRTRRVRRGTSDANARRQCHSRTRACGQCQRQQARAAAQHSHTTR
jgi:glycosyltransferase involved in cell wall biosynthesis